TSCWSARTDGSTRPGRCGGRLDSGNDARERYTPRMAIKDALLPEYDHEMGATRRVLERVPEADLAWKPHDKSFSLGQLAGHVANIPHWMAAIFDNAVFDLATVGEDARPREPASV